MSPRHVEPSGVRRNRTLAVDLELLVRVAGVGGRLELSLDSDGTTLALILPAEANSIAYGERGATPGEAVKRLRDALERLAG